jgi:tRNA (guanine26-N2/guanine27-N2)-dimethyltransferase
MKKIQEGSAVIEVPEETKVSKKLEVFYNPVMKLNRDVSVLLLNAIENKRMQIADPMAGTGVRSIRFIKELKKGKMKRISVNDLFSIDKIKNNFKLNKIKINKKKIEFYSKDANEFLLQSNGFDYIDIDPFGTPNDFLDSAVKRISRNGILAVTATDTAVLTGTYPKAGLRDYWASTYLNGFMHESSLRILARKVQLIGAQYDKALIPILSYAKEHYVRIFFRCIKGKEDADEIMKQHKFILYNPKTLAYEVSDKNFKEDYVAIGPLFVGSLCDENLIRRMKKDATDEAKGLLEELFNELDVVGSYDLHKLSKILKIHVPRYESLLKKTKGSKVHYSDKSIKTKLNIEELKKIISSASH